MRIISKVFLLLLVLSASVTAADLNIYLVDVEGGQSTLIVAPSGQSLLIDTGIAGAEGRDPKRIFELATKVAHLSKIDYLLITHTTETISGEYQRSPK
jgi:glyoxylase-like metal-dependent hydrolase (beta-lactamase superfamily II)